MTPWPDWLKVIQLKPRFLFGIWLIGVLILFLPNRFEDDFGIKAFRDNYKGWIGIGTLAAFTFWLVQLIPVYNSHRNIQRRQKEIIDSLNALSQDERILLAFCVCRKQQTINLEITDRAATALVAKDLMISADGIGDNLAWPFTIPDFLWKQLLIDPQLVLLGVSPSDPSLLSKFQRIEAHIRRWDHLRW